MRIYNQSDNGIGVENKIVIYHTANILDSKSRL